MQLPSMVLINNVRSQRQPDVGKCGTTEFVGPGSYNLLKVAVAEESNVPFQSLSDRPNLARMQSNLNTPGPGSYTVRRAAGDHAPDERFIGSSASAFRSHSPQISPVVVSSKDNPGPGEYSVAGNLARPRQVKKDSGHGLSSISYSKSMPSMPPMRDPGTMRFSGCKDDRVGPGGYDGTIPGQLCRTLPATNFHASPSKRQIFAHTNSIDNFMAPPDQPGPDAFRVSTELVKGTSSGFLSKVAQVPPMSIGTGDGPGPGTYEDEGAWSSREKSLGLASLRSTSERSQSWQLLSHPFTHPEYIYKVPGPGTYPNPPGFNGTKQRRARSTSDVLDKRKFHGVHQPHTMISLRDSDGMKLWGFDASDERLCNKPLRDNGVPSLTYNIEESMGQSMQANLRQSAKIGRKGVFGSSGDRFHGSAFAPPPDSESSPGPGESQNLEHRDGYQSLKGDATVPGFRSTQKRLPRDPMVDTSPKPEPGTYEPFDKVNYRSKYRLPKTDHLSFGSSATRWAPNETSAGQKHTSLPGPGEYDTSLVVGHVVGGAMGKQHRMIQTRHEGLGPGIYNVHGSTMHRSTFNVSSVDAALRAQGKFGIHMEPPNIGGGAGGGIAGTRSRLGHCPGGSGANAAAADQALWEEDKKLKAARARAVAKASKKGWSAIQDTQDSNAAVSSTGIAQAPVPMTATTSPPATWSKKDNASEAKSTVEGASAEERPVEAEAAVTPSATSAAIPA